MNDRINAENQASWDERAAAVAALLKPGGLFFRVFP
jgi:hypothetical protein